MHDSFLSPIFIHPSAAVTDCLSEISTLQNSNKTTVTRLCQFYCSSDNFDDLKYNFWIENKDFITGVDSLLFLTPHNNLLLLSF